MYVSRGFVSCPHCSHERGKKGRIRRYKHIEDGICFTCDGQGEITEQKAETIKNDMLMSSYKLGGYGKKMSFEEFKKMRREQDQRELEGFEDLL